jgi:HK97 family phage major capsid protein
MPTNPYTLPTLDSDMTFKYASAENTAVTATDLNTGNATLTAAKIMAEVDFSTEVTEDSIIPIVPAIRATLVRRAAQTIDDLIVSGDTETGGTGNVNSDDTAPVAGDFYLALNGMRKFCIVTNTGQVSNVAAALSTTNFLTIRGLLGRYGARPSDLRIVVGQSTLNTMYDIASVRTIDVYGPNATIVQGELARFFGIPILAYEAIPLLASDKTAADAKADSATPTNNTLGWILLFNRNGWKLGFRRELVIESWRDIKKDQNVLTASFRQALIPSGIVTTHTAVGRNITV